MKKPRLKKCDICKTPFAQNSSLHTVCSAKCAIDQAKAKAVHKANRERLAGLKKLKTITDYTKDAQASINRYVRLRDYNKPCISCNRHHLGQYHAGHYQTTKAASSIRFNLCNLNKQCSTCNNHLSGNIVEYRKRLIEKIGLEKVEWLENNNESRRYTIGYLERLRKIFNKKARILKARILNKMIK